MIWERLKWGAIVILVIILGVVLLAGKLPGLGFLWRKARLAERESAARIAKTKAVVAEIEAEQATHQKKSEAALAKARAAHTKAEVVEQERLALLAQMKQDRELTNAEYARRFNRRYGLGPD